MSLSLCKDARTNPPLRIYPSSLTSPTHTHTHTHTHTQALKTRNLKTTGKKEELLTRLRGDITRTQREEGGWMGVLLQQQEEEAKATAEKEGNTHTHTHTQTQPKSRWEKGREKKEEEEKRR